MIQEKIKLFERIYKYASKIVDGRIKACEKHIRACERFLNDLEKSQNESYKFYFDTEEVYRFYKWAKMFKHRAGVLKGQNIELVDFQLFLTGNIFGWKDKQTNLRRFRKAYIQLSRKNAKSQLLALISSYECFLSDEQSEVYISGWDREQSSIVYKEIINQIQACKLLKNKYKDSYGKVTHLKSGSIIKPLSREAKKTGDGTNPSLGICDEYHCHQTSEIYDVINSGMVARKQPLMVIITTAGFNLNYPCYTEYKYVSSIIDPNSSIENEQYFVVICELDKDDDIKDESNWIKSNPIVATYNQGLEYLRNELQSALDVPEKMKNFLTKNMNKWVDQKDDGYMSMEKWGNCGTDFDFSLIEGLECIVGLDLSAKIDLTSIGFEFKLEDGKYVVLSHSFMPEDTLKSKIKSDKVPYDLWVKQGWITITPGAVVDYNFIMKYIMDFELKYKAKVKEICYDPWNALQFSQEMGNRGYLMLEIRQGIPTLGEPTKNFREEVYAGNIMHDNNPVLNWAVSNAITRQDHNQNIMLDKSKATERIDPIASVINAHVRAMRITNKQTKVEFWSF